MSLNSVGGMLPDDDVWDDSELIKAYDKAVKNWKKTKKEIESGVAETAGPGPWVSVEDGKNDVSNAKSESVNLGGDVWVVGIPCRAIYSEDCLEYEAKLVEIKGASCVVKFIGYGNEEVVDLIDLKQSLGKKVRDKQRRDALQITSASTRNKLQELDDNFSAISLTSSMYNNYPETEDCDPYPNCQPITVPKPITPSLSSASEQKSEIGVSGNNIPLSSSFSNKDLQHKQKQQGQQLEKGKLSDTFAAGPSSVASDRSPSLSSSQSILHDVNRLKDFQDFMPHFPVPPLPVSMAEPDGSFDYGKGGLPAVLMSWYMAGYQAGYFDAKQQLQRNNTRAAEGANSPTLSQN